MNITAKHLDLFIGPSLLVVSVEDGRLTVHRRPDWTTTLSPEDADTFDAPELGVIRFIRSPAGRVTGLSLRRARVYDMRFQRVEDGTP